MRRGVVSLDIGIGDTSVVRPAEQIGLTDLRQQLCDRDRYAWRCQFDLTRVNSAPRDIPALASRVMDDHVSDGVYDQVMANAGDGEILRHLVIGIVALRRW